MQEDSEKIVWCLSSGINTVKCSVFEIRKILILLTKSNDSQYSRGREGTVVIHLNQEPNSLPHPLTHKQPDIYIWDFYLAFFSAAILITQVFIDDIKLDWTLLNVYCFLLVYYKVHVINSSQTISPFELASIGINATMKQSRWP